MTDKNSELRNDIIHKIIPKITNVKFQRSVLESNINFNRMVNSMAVECGRRCISNLKNHELSDNENICVINCQNKYFEMFTYCDDYSNNITEKLIKSTNKRLNPLQFIEENELKFT
jgi:hypothetical protein